MLRERLLKFTLIVLLFGSDQLMPTAFAEPNSNPDQMDFEIKHSKFALVPKITVGIVTGAAADAIKAYDDDFGAKFLYGGGISGEYNVSRKFAVGIDFGVAYKSIPKSSLESIRGISFGLSGIFKFRPENKSSVFIGGGLGRTKMTIPGYYAFGSRPSTGLELGTFDYLKIGIGMQNYFGSTNTSRSEIYFRTFFTDGATVPVVGQVDFNTTYVGLELAWGIGLF